MNVYGCVSVGRFACLCESPSCKLCLRPWKMRWSQISDLRPWEVLVASCSCEVLLFVRFFLYLFALSDLPLLWSRPRLTPLSQPASGSPTEEETESPPMCLPIIGLWISRQVHATFFLPHEERRFLQDMMHFVQTSGRCEYPLSRYRSKFHFQKRTNESTLDCPKVLETESPHQSQASTSSGLVTKVHSKLSKLWKEPRGTLHRNHLPCRALPLEISSKASITKWWILAKLQMSVCRRHQRFQL